MSKEALTLESDLSRLNEALSETIKWTAIFFSNGVNTHQFLDLAASIRIKADELHTIIMHLKEQENETS